MFGTLRYILAILVLVGHAFPAGPIHINDGAVIVFFMLSGYVMTFMIRGSYGKLGKPTWYFYLDRLLRIYPQYFLFLVITQICLLCFDFPFFPFFFKSEASPFLFFLNALIVPVNYAFLYSPLAAYQIIPTAWSLGLEEQFYWVFPFLVLKKYVAGFFTFVSLAVFFLAMMQVLDPELFGYRLLPGTLFMFMLGKNLADYQQNRNRASLITILLLYTCCAGLLINTFVQPEFELRNNQEILGAVIVGFPVMWLLSLCRRRAWDEWIGNASYGVFLCHILVYNIVLEFGLFTQTATSAIACVIVLSTAMAFAGYYLVERFVKPFRLRLRARHRAPAENQS